jgi:hypothetical protein
VIDRNWAGITCGDLVRALERARTRFAVAIAAEAKRTPVDRWQSYLETERHIRHWVKQLRLQQRTAVPPQADWKQLLESVRNLPAPARRPRSSEAQILNQHLQKILAKLRE